MIPRVTFSCNDENRKKISLFALKIHAGHTLVTSNLSARHGLSDVESITRVPDVLDTSALHFIAVAALLRQVSWVK